jgi:hypothetical protein
MTGCIKCYEGTCGPLAAGCRTLSQGDQIEEQGMGGACSPHKEDEKHKRNVSGKEHVKEEIIQFSVLSLKTVIRRIKLLKPKFI